MKRLPGLSWLKKYTSGLKPQMNSESPGATRSRR